jgi:hypothetical protein
MGVRFRLVSAGFRPDYPQNEWRMSRLVHQGKKPNAHDQIVHDLGVDVHKETGARQRAKSP